MTIYLDCNATTPIEPAVAELVVRFTTQEFGNAGSRTHEFGTRAKQAVQEARDHVAKVVGASREDVLFTSGATESNNLAILGLAAEGERTGRKHLISTKVEHKAVLEPLEHLESLGFSVTLLNVDQRGWVDPEALRAALQKDTLLVSVMHVNNETGVRQPIQEIAGILEDHPSYYHVDAAQGFGKEIEPLRLSRIDLISISGHKIYGPKGVGALIVRRRGYKRPPLTPLMYGGGQERGLRPGTLPVPLVVGLGEAARLALRDSQHREEACARTRKEALDALESIGASINGGPTQIMSHVLNVSIPGVSAEAAMVALKGLVAISNGSACTSHSYTPSHVLEGMGLSKDQILSSIRISWCHMTPEVDWNEVTNRLAKLR
jgi:cysteine desulfurase